MTWKEIKDRIEELGVKDESIIAMITIEGTNSDRSLSISEDSISGFQIWN